MTKDFVEVRLRLSLKQAESLQEIADVWSEADSTMPRPKGVQYDIKAVCRALISRAEKLAQKDLRRISFLSRLRASRLRDD